jgi:hypothetical protein
LPHLARERVEHGPVARALQLLPATCTVQPWCVQMALNPTTFPAVGRASAMLPVSAWTTTEPPTGTWLSCARLSPPADDPPDAVDAPASPPADAVVDVVEPFALAHAASVPRPVLPRTAARTTVRRSGVASGCMGGTIASGSEHDRKGTDGRNG